MSDTTSTGAPETGPPVSSAPTTLTELGIGEDKIDEAIEKMIPTLRKNKGEVFGSFKKLTMEDAEEIYRSAV